MDQKELQQKIAEYYDKLPSDVQAIFSSMKWLETLETISTKYNLNEKQKETLATETTLLLLSILSPMEYADNLIKELEIADENIVKNILEEIDSSILKDIAPKLYETYNKNGDELVKKEVEKAGVHQNVNFITSGGDYSHFAETKKEEVVIPVTPSVAKTPDPYRMPI